MQTFVSKRVVCSAILLALSGAPAVFAQSLILPGDQLRRQGQALYQSGDLDGAERIFSQLSRMTGDAGFNGVNGLYDVYEKRGKTREGFEQFRKYYERTGNLEALAFGALRLAESGLTEESHHELEPLFAQLKKGDKLDPGVTYRMALAERRNGNLELALDAGKRCEEDLRTAGMPNWVNIGDMVAQTYEDLGRTLEALNEYEFLLHDASDNPLILNNFAYHLAVHNKELPRALKMVQQSVDLDPNGNSLDTLGFILLKLGRGEEAIDAMVRSWRQVPDEMVVRTHLAQALATRKSKSETMHQLLDVLRTEPDEENTAAIDKLLLEIGK